MKNSQKSECADKTVDVWNPKGRAPVVFVCEHASNFFPPEYGALGLDEAAQMSHIAWDPGAFAVARGLADRFDAPLVHACASRLLYDCNRPPEAVDAIPARSEITDVPGNFDLGADQRAARVARFYDPFCAKLSAVLDAQNPVAMITIHSFTRVYKGQARAVELGILHDDDARLADAMLAHADETTMRTRRNDPYGPADGVTHTLKIHAMARGIANVMIEIRNDLLVTEAQQGAVTDDLTRMIRAAMADIGHPITDEAEPCPKS
jgi:predicted N-formylglutamate amidohydrolase